MARVVQVAVPVLLGVGSVRVYAMSEDKNEKQLSPRQLSIYAPQESRQYAEEQPGALQRRFGSVRQSLQPFFCIAKSVGVSVITLYHAGEDVYYFLKDPLPGFVPRVALISASALTGLILSRKGSRLKRLGLPLGLVAAGFAVCFPVQALTVLKEGGKKVYAASRWTSSTVAALWKSSPSTATPESTEEAGPSESVSETRHTRTARASRTEQILSEVPPPSELASPTSNFLVVSTEGKHADQRRPEMLPVHISKILQTPPEKRSRKEAQQLMDYGQSNPADADLYSTRS